MKTKTLWWEIKFETAFMQKCGENWGHWKVGRQINGRQKQLKISTCLNKNRIYSLLSVGKYNKFKKTLKSMNKQNGKQENGINS